MGIHGGFQHLADRAAGEGAGEGVGAGGGVRQVPSGEVDAGGWWC